MLKAAVAFGRVLRGAGLRAGTDRIVEFARALQELDPTLRNDVYWAGRVTLVSRPEDVDLYDRAFEVFWERQVLKVRQKPKVRLTIPQPDKSVLPPKKTVERSDRGDEAVRLRYSPIELLRRKDFALYSPEESDRRRGRAAPLQKASRAAPARRVALRRLRFYGPI